MSHYIPSSSNVDDSGRPAKRLRADTEGGLNTFDRNSRKQSSFRSQRRGGVSKPYGSRPNRYERTTYRRQNAAVDLETQSRNRKSKKERRENPSTRIHSLRKLLGRDSLPATIQQEKERELAALLFDQQTTAIKKDAKKNLKRYHFVRFVERQKATRVLKQLTKRRESGEMSGDLDRQIHQAEVDLNYTLYAPLAQKYIAIYARDDTINGKARPLPRNLSKMKKADYSILSNEQQTDIEQTSMEAANVVQLAPGAHGEKPPMWYAVEAAMREAHKSLESLRDEQSKADGFSSSLVVGKGPVEAPDWLQDGGEINSEDMDSEPDSQYGGAPLAAREDGDGDEDMSDGDGGFFEKR